jgi:hypothetical protein
MESQVPLRQLVLLEGFPVGRRGGGEKDTVTVRERRRGDSEGEAEKRQRQR